MKIEEGTMRGVLVLGALTVVVSGILIGGAIDARRNRESQTETDALSNRLASIERAIESQKESAKFNNTIYEGHRTVFDVRLKLAESRLDGLSSAVERLEKQVQPQAIPMLPIPWTNGLECLTNWAIPITNGYTPAIPMTNLMWATNFITTNNVILLGVGR